jgi:hypothetical protein
MLYKAPKKGQGIKRPEPVAVDSDGVPVLEVEVRVQDSSP